MTPRVELPTIADLNASWEEFRLAKIKADRPGTLEEGLAARRAWISFSEMTDEYIKAQDIPPRPPADRSNVAVFPVHRSRCPGR